MGQIKIDDVALAKFVTHPLNGILRDGRFQQGLAKYAGIGSIDSKGREHPGLVLPASVLKV